jgi:hypothetical protein
VTRWRAYTADAKKALVVSCARQGCNGTTVVKPGEPRLVLAWGDDEGAAPESDGILAVCR